MGRLSRRMTVHALVSMTTCAALVIGLATPALPETANDSSGTERLCSDPSPGFLACFAERKLPPPGASPFTTTPSGYGPADLTSAYKIPAGLGAGKTVAIVDAHDLPTAEADLGVYRSEYGLSACTTANGCFRKINQTGGTTPPTADSGWGGEIALDMDMASATCPACKILLVEANSASSADLGTAVNQAASQPGVVAISNSYGGPEDSTITGDDHYYDHPGIAVTASSGDSGYGVSWPASSPYVTSVGGTSLTRTTSNARGWSETVWGSASNFNGGAGSGCSAYEAKPSFQHDSGCAKRTVADVSAVADPNTGVAVYDSYGGAGGWQVYGGTSASSPIVASVFAMAAPAQAGAYPVTYPYANPAALFDVTSGANGSCSGSYLCTAKTGYDGPTGLGTPNGVAAFGPGAAPAVAESPNAVNPGAALTATWSGISSPTSQDWIAVYANTAGSAPDTGTRVAWRYTNGAASGALPITTPATTPTGSTYELRLFSNNSYTKLATSSPFGLAQPTLSESPNPVNAGSAVTASWAGISSPTSQNWIGVFANTAASAPDSGTRVAWRFITSGSAGSLPITIPTGTPAGTTYELRLFANNSFTKLATSPPFSVNAPTLSESPNPVNPGAAVTATWSGIPSPTSQDWIAVFANAAGSAPDTGTRVAWRFTNGAASGSLPITLPATASPGTAYELRLFSNNSFTKLTTSSPFTVAAPTLSGSPSPVNPGLSLTATWAGISSPTSQDWIAVFASSGVADTGTRVAWKFTNGAASGSVPIQIPVGTPAGTTYELRLFANNSYTKLATSSPFSVVAPTLTGSPSPVTRGSVLTATWSGISGPTSQDWIAVFASSGTADTGTRVAWHFTNGAASGSMPITIPATATPGTTYELRLFSNNGFTKLATSAPFSVQCLLHPNGLGQSYSDCSPLGTPGTASTYNATMANEAASAWTTSGAISSATCGSGPTLAQVVIKQGTSSAAVWAYTGSSAGHVFLNSVNNTPTCPITTDPTWQ